MQEFINQVFSFFGNLYSSIVTYFTNTGLLSFFESFIDKQIFDGTLISIGLSWHELFIILIPIIISLLFIVLIFKLILKAFSLFRL